jgi:hypothetical protein
MVWQIQQNSLSSTVNQMKILQFCAGLRRDGQPAGVMADCRCAPNVILSLRRFSQIKERGCSREHPLFLCVLAEIQIGVVCTLTE